MITPLLPDPRGRPARAATPAATSPSTGTPARSPAPRHRQQNLEPLHGKGAQVIVVQFPPGACRACPVRDKCTRSARSGRQLTLRPRPVHEAVAAARAQQETTQWQAEYASRAGVEGLMKQATHVTGIRRARYLGLPKTALEHNIAAAALNLIRLDAWHNGNPPDRGHPTHLQRLHLAA